MLRRKTRSVKLGPLGIGSEFPVTIQSMTNIPLGDVSGSPTLNWYFVVTRSDASVVMSANVSCSS